MTHEMRPRDIPRLTWMRLAMDMAREICHEKGVEFHSMNDMGVWFQTKDNSTGVVLWADIDKAGGS